MKTKKIPDGELFADLQMSLTDIVLMEMIQDGKFEKRLAKEKVILDKIKHVVRKRFSDDQIKDFLENGYPRRIDLSAAIR